jgi:hypothetical protein
VLLFSLVGPATATRLHPREIAGAKNRLQLDIEVGNRLAEVERLAAKGAKVIAQFESWTVLRDPEGNEFCLTDRS